ncbi:unnamed protein product [Nezara viridula]|uniref:Uncharacterized protein n=1 Tax=Nezara viridula TaxID=85310 RepID=A0A9P0HBP1_NEZVI|nr:unnamed protein product [Nezara viridula]
MNASTEGERPRGRSTTKRIDRINKDAIEYVLPLAVTAYLYIRMSRKLQTEEGPMPVMMFEGVRPRASGGSHDFR